MNGWNSVINPQDPFWEDVIELIKSSDSERFPGVDKLNQWLPPQARNQQGLPIRFVSAERLPGVAYEEHIYSSGQVSTRSDNWHDLFNALVWVRFPLLKSAMNAVHHASMPQSDSQGRGSQRDALTLFDECGVIYASADKLVLEALASRQWAQVFAGDIPAWSQNRRMFVAGHAMFEKLLQPYKAMTANALLVHVPPSLLDLSRHDSRKILDAALASELLEGQLFKTTADLCPLPLMGVPGWWSRDDQDEAFYADERVFRPPPDRHRPTAVFSIF